MDRNWLRNRIASVAGWLVAALLVVVALTIGNPPPADAGPKKFYVTVDTFQGDQALTACANGFHMASLWEIRDTGNLTYDTARGVTQPDSGDGPPTDVSGWVRTGFLSSVAGITGQANCGAWTLNSFGFGTVVILPTAWTFAPSAISPWAAGTSSCDGFRPVWCVQD